MSNENNSFKRKKSADEEVIYAENNPYIISSLPCTVISEREKIILVCRPQKIKSPYLELVALFLCIAVSLGADAFIFSSALFSEIFGVTQKLMILVEIACLIVHTVPEIMWGIRIYKKFGIFASYTVVLTSERLIACGGGFRTETKCIKLEDVIDMKLSSSSLTVVSPLEKITFSSADVQILYDEIKKAYESL